MVLMEIIDQVRARPAALQISSLVAGCHLPLLFVLFVCLGVASAGRSGNGCDLGIGMQLHTLLESAVPK